MEAWGHTTWGSIFLATDLLLSNDDPLTFEQYYGRKKKGDRQSASNILPILVKKGLIQDYHHKESHEE